MMEKKVNKNFWKVVIFLVVGIYLLTHLTALTLLPVFADEAIYIRWAQLIIDDWQRYLFFPMNDGKTPLFIWLLKIALTIWDDPLYAGRIVSVLAGLAQLFVTLKLIKKLGGGLVAKTLALFAVMFLPYWYFHHRMALMDGFLTLLLSSSLCYLLTSFTSKKPKDLILAGLFLGLSLWTKIPAILFFPTLILVTFLPGQKTSVAKKLQFSSLVIILGVGLFATLKLSPIFPQLFSRGGDFLYPISELIEKGILTVFWANTQRIFQGLFSYLSWPIMLLPFFGLFQDKLRKTHAVLILSFLGFTLPILLLGKTIYPRYILPSILPLTLSAVLSLEYIIQKAQANIKKPLTFFLQTTAIILMLTSIVQTAVTFTLISWKNPNYLPLVPIDTYQYLSDWGAGNGIKESTDLMLAEIKNGQSLAVATEGHFGTLPDGVLMYLHNKNVNNLLVEGIGQPIYQLETEFLTKSNNYEQTWLLVNSHRQELKLRENYPNLLKAEFCRIKNAPCLELWDITSIKNELPNQ